ncbi:MAG: hypothetical protein ACKV2V_06325 [Blastocatellia bacterium]
MWPHYFATTFGSNLLFHEICEQLDIPTRLYLALPRDQYIGEYVAPAGAAWVDRFNKVYRSREAAGKPGRKGAGQTRAADAPKSEAPDDAAKNESKELDSDVGKIINILSDTRELPRWLQGKSGYNLERRCHMWMLQHALVQRHIHERDGLDIEITLITLWDGSAREGLGGISHLIELAERNGIKVVKIDCREWLAARPAMTARPAIAARSKGDMGKNAAVQTPAPDPAPAPEMVPALYPEPASESEISGGAGIAST